MYVYNLGDGNDVIKDDDNDDREADRIKFGAGISLSDLVLSGNPNDINELRIGFVGHAGSIRIERQWDNYYGGVETLEFADGTVIDQAALAKIYAAQQTTSGDDRVAGTQYDDILAGGSGTDTLYGWNGRDVLTGGTGDDRLEGGEQGDVYVYNLGDGNDVIKDDDNDDREADRIKFGAGISLSDLIIYRPNAGSRDLYIGFRQGTGSILIERQDEFYGGIEAFEFADGTILNQSQLPVASTFITAGNDVIDGTSGADVLYGMGGNDRIQGLAGDDNIDGGAGDDVILGDALPVGNNLIVNGSFETSGTVVGSGGWGIANSTMPGWIKNNSQTYEQVYSGYAGIQATDGSFWLDMDSGGGSGSNMDISQTIDGLTQGQVMLLSFDHIGRSGNNSSDFEIRWNGEVVGTYSDYGSTLRTDSLQLQAVAGSNIIQFIALGSADNTGAALDNIQLLSTQPLGEITGNDILRGATGNDQITGGLGDDRYLFDRGDGQDLIFENAGQGIDRIMFGAGITPSDITVANPSGSDLLLQLLGSTDQILIKGGTDATTIEEVVFADGTVWSRSGGGFTPRYTAGNDILTGTDQTDGLRGGDGDDVLTGHAGADRLAGDAGADQIAGGDGEDTLLGGSGNDVLSGGDGADSLDGGAGDDILDGGAGDDILLYTGADNGLDTIDGGTGLDVLRAGAAGTIIGIAALTNVEVITADGFSNVTIIGSADNDTVDFSAVTMTGIALIDAGVGNDIIVGSMAADVLRGGIGNDQLSGGGGDDVLDGGEGADALFGDAGADDLRGGSGNDTLDGGAGNDLLAGGADDDRIKGGSGDDTIAGGSGNDVIDGGSGDDILAGNDGDDTFNMSGDADGYDAIDGGAGYDRVLAGVDGTVIGLTQADGLELVTADGHAGIRIEGSSGADRLDFASTELVGIDRIDGDAGNDIIIGSTSGDVIAGGLGDDVLNGGAGDDTFQYYRGDGDDMVADTSGDDLLVLSGIAASDVSVSYSSSLDDYILTIAGGGRITLKGAASDPAKAIEKIGFLGSTVWSADQLKTMADATLSRIDGTASADSLTGTTGNDLIAGRGGNDTIDGGLGVDVALYFGGSTGYTLTTSNGLVTVVDDDPATAGDEGTDTLVGVEKVQFDNTRIGLAAPIVLDVDGNGVNLISRISSGAKFDWDGDGMLDATGWVSPGDALLFYDRNGDGIISGADEVSFVTDKPSAKSDLDGLTAFDSNGDGNLSAGDNAWRSLGVWHDTNGDGMSQVGELQNLDTAGITSLDLKGVPVDGSWNWDQNILLNETTFTRIDGSVGVAADVVLNYTPAEVVARRTQMIHDIRPLPAIIPFPDPVWENTATDVDTGSLAQMGWREKRVEDNAAMAQTDEPYDRRLLLMTQSIAGFGPRTATHTSDFSDTVAPARYEYFA
ncbi:calcium-binding protein [Sphingomonas sp. CFBP9021]|uniref:calcium-binding protein n=1 Tax=Sphingomonas sp. CFBP9021 TaxID=3096534 RepID=UPI002A6A6766|nr:calcium-binding protein [Sphingomonas sp. CFBP9021]MDY0969117.1 calcium-binding protein [Sphingomonas sp. CFBP9021]